MTPSQEAALAQHKALILARLSETEDKSAKQAGWSLPIGAQRVTRCLALLVKDGAIHVSRTYGSTKFYRLGAGEWMQVPAEDRILGALANGPLIADEIGEAIGFTGVYVREVINAKLSVGDARRVRITGYIKQGKQRVKVFGLGDKPDAPRPRPFTGVEKTRRYNARRKKDPEKAMLARAKDLLRKRAANKPDPFMAQFAGLFGKNNHPIDKVA